LLCSLSSSRKAALCPTLGVGCGLKTLAWRSSSVFPKRGSEGQLRAEVAGDGIGRVSAVDWRWWRGAALPIFPKCGFQRSGRLRPLRAAEAAGGSSLNRRGSCHGYRSKVFIIRNLNLSDVMDKEDKQDISEISDQIQKKLKKSKKL
jgi:hypothetical protein